MRFQTALFCVMNLSVFRSSSRYIFLLYEWTCKFQYVKFLSKLRLADVEIIICIFRGAYALCPSSIQTFL